MRRVAVLIAMCCGWALAGAQTPALPVLGESFAPTAAQSARAAQPTAQLQATQRQLASSGAHVAALQDDRGNRLRVYTDQSGRVFGLAWQGTTMPDLKTMLGGYFAAFQSVVAQRHRRGPLEVTVDGVVVDLGGHARALRGRAYLKTAIPGGLTPAVVQ